MNNIQFIKWALELTNQEYKGDKTILKMLLSGVV